VGSQYDNTKFIRVLKEYFGNTLLGELKWADSMRVAVPAFLLDSGKSAGPPRRWKPKIFHNFPGDDSDAMEPVVKVALATSAAPTYFPTFDGYIDGGVYANNPSMIALAQSQDARAIANPPPLKSLAILSLGTGLRPIYIAGNKDWGWGQWAKPIVDVMMDGAMGVADFQCRQLLGRRYHRLNPVLPPRLSAKLDDVNRVDAIVRFAESNDDAIKSTVAETVQWIKDIWLK
jgi:patatin-like phospholipase/acyl hydrolase